jgi:3-phosphoshikimate 1-carboxyvinyltransferase
LLPVAAALGLEADFKMEGRLPDRPLAPLDEQLTAHGVRLSRPCRELLHVSGQLEPGDYVLPGNVSSQYISGLLFALPLLQGTSTLTVTGKIESAPYIAMTLDALKQFGVQPECHGNVYTVSPTAYRSPGTAVVEGDWSNAAFWLCAGALSGPVTVTGLNPDSLQGDRVVADLLAQFGASITQKGTACTAAPGPLRGIDMDAAPIPDLIPALAMVAAAAQGTTTIRNAARLRLKESDRLAAIVRLLRDLGGQAETTADTLIIHGGNPLTGGTADSCGDHRIAMAAAIAAVLCEGPVTVTGAEAVNKSYPDFWNDFRQLASL